MASSRCRRNELRYSVPSQGRKGRSEGMGRRVFQPENIPQGTVIIDALEAVPGEIGSNPGRVACSAAGERG